MAKKKILLIEDEKDIVDLVAYNLKREGFNVVSAQSGEQGLKKAKSDIPDLVLLDLMLPGINGLDVCRALKAEKDTRHIPVIMLTARNEDVDIVTGLEVGADDYVTKPFSPRVLIARIRSALRKKEGQAEPETETATIRLKDLVIDTGRYSITAGGVPVDLTFTEFQLLLIMARRPGWVFSRSQLIDELREGQQVITDRAIDVQIANLRKKLGQYSEVVETIRGVGYRIREWS